MSTTVFKNVTQGVTRGIVLSNNIFNQSDPSIDWILFYNIVAMYRDPKHKEMP